MCFYVLILIFYFFQSVADSQQINLYKSDIQNEFRQKKRITEILKKENYKLIEPYYFIGNRPTISQALAEEFKNKDMIPPEALMTYCRGGTVQTRKGLSSQQGTVYISADRLPKDGSQNQIWFHEAYGYRTDQDAMAKPANILMITPKKQNYLGVQCPQDYRMLTASLYDSRQVSPPLILEQSPHLKNSVTETPYDVNDYHLPSTEKNRLKRVHKVEETFSQSVELGPPKEIVRLARMASQEEKIFIKLLLAIAQVSSNYQEDYRDGVTGKRGLMGLSPQVIRFYKIPPDFISDNGVMLRTAAQYLKRLNYQFSGNLDQILKAYALGIMDTNENIFLETEDAILFAKEVQRFVSPAYPIVLE